MTLFDMTAEFRQLLDVLDECDGEPTPEALAELEAIEGDIKNKADGYCSLIRHYELIHDACAEEAYRIATRAEYARNKVNWLRQRLHDAVLRTGAKKIQTATNTISVCGNGGVTPIDITIDHADLPVEYRYSVTEWRAKSDAIRADLEAGLHVPGCVLKERGTHLRIK